MDPAALAPNGPADGARLLAGIALFLLPGLAAADRLLPRLSVRWALAPVFSATLYPVAAIALDFVGVPVTPAATALLGLAATALFAQRRIVAWLDPRVAA
jgi:hypothetical protein